MMVLVGGACLTLAASPALAQQSSKKKPAAKEPAAPAKSASKGAPPDAAWVKLCEKNAKTGNKEICLTHHERIDGNSGMVLVAAAIRTVQGQDKKTLLVRLPTAIALAIPAGVQIRVDDNKPVMLKYTLCYAASCQAETDMTPALLQEFRKGKQLVVAAVNLQRKAIGFPVPLEGFSKAFDGPPVDPVKYEEARRKLMEMIRQRQMELAKRAAEAQKEKQAGAGKSAPMKGASTTPSAKTAVPVH